MSFYGCFLDIICCVRFVQELQDPELKYCKTEYLNRVKLASDRVQFKSRFSTQNSIY